jgi:hypothetical protein
MTRRSNFTSGPDKKREPIPPRYTIKEVAAAYCVGIGTVRGWIESGELDVVDVSGPTSRRRRVVIPLPALDRFDALRNPRAKGGSARSRRPVRTEAVTKFF